MADELHRVLFNSFFFVSAIHSKAGLTRAQDRRPSQLTISITELYTCLAWRGWIMNLPDEEQAGETSFREWAFLFSGKYFAMIIVYADESGTHDPTGNRQGSTFPIIAGFAARKSTWDTFCVSWKAMLSKYDVPFFHGRELEGARLAIVENRPITKELAKNPYISRKWNLEKIESFRKSLTKVAVAGNKIPIAGGIDLRVFQKIKGTLPEEQKYPYKYCMSHFFTVYHDETELQWGKFKSDVSFYFDWSENEEWRDAILEVFGAYQKKDTRMRGPNFEKKTVLIPLQAADLLAYRMRKLLEDAKNDRLKLDDLDHVLLGNLWKSAMIKYPHLKARMLKHKFKKP